MKLSCHALNETLNRIKKIINVLNISLIPFNHKCLWINRRLQVKHERLEFSFKEQETEF